MTPTDTVLARLRDRGCNPKQSRAGQWTSRCPNTAGHKNGDKHPSLSIAEGREGCVVHCEGGCEPTAVVEALDLTMSDLFPPRERDEQRRVERTYDYHDEEGTLVFQCVRYTPKGFTQRQPNGIGGWTWNLRGIERRPLYRLPQTLAAVAAGETIWVVEGEKDADALVAAGYTATCNPMGAGKWRPEHTEWVTGATLVEIVADDDEAGIAHARSVRDALADQVAEVRLWLPHNGCKDVAEHLGQGRPLADLRPLTDPDETALSRLRSNLYIGAEILRLPPVQWLVKDVLQAEGLTVVYGPPKSFKTFVTLDMALHVANGRPWRDLKVEQAKVLYVVAEGAPGVGPRARAWVQRFGGSLDNMAWLTVAPDLFDAAGNDTREVTDIATELGCGLVVVDTLARCMPGGEENSSRDMGVVIGHFDHIKEVAGAAVMAVHHTGKDQARGMRGSNSLQGAVDMSLEVIGDKHAVNARTVDGKNAESDKAWWWKPEREEPSLVLKPTQGLDSSGEVRDVNILRQLQLIDTGGGVPTNTWLDAVTDREICGKTLFHERLKALQDDGLVENGGSSSRPKWSLTTVGQRLIEQATG
jgi:hypothetical protein